MRILVTGNEGYIGSLLVPRLIAAGHDVRGLDTGLFRECAIGPIAAPPTLQKDVRDVEKEDVDGYDAIIHLAGLANDPLGDLDPPLTFDINHGATVRLAELAKQAGVRRFLYASTCSVYGAAGDNFIDEDSTTNPVTPYADSKVLSENDLIRLADHSFCPVFLRAATAYGVSPYLRFDLAVNNLVAWAYSTGRVFLKSDGQSWRPFVHIDDIASAYVALLDAPDRQVNAQAFNVGATDENYRICDLAEQVRDNVPNSRIEFANDASPDHRSYRVRCERIKQVLPGYQNRWSVRDGIIEVRDAIERAGVSPEDFEGARYNRIAHVRRLLDSGRLQRDLRWTRSLAAKTAHQALRKAAS
ncbi:MAG: NAD-dependent epimerase/dehydratase family protein [Geminicoccaceae bacterium]